MPRVRKKRLDKGREARRLARKIAPTPGSTRVVPDKRKKPEKHKKRLSAEEE
ncbi:MAG: hypothetical protein WAK20_17475 [Candidatus Acidiferrum sp.]